MFCFIVKQCEDFREFLGSFYTPASESSLPLDVTVRGLRTSALQSRMKGVTLPLVGRRKEADRTGKGRD
jgi:hypothetical protein